MKTIEQFKQELHDQGLTALEWAKRHNFPAWAVYRVLAGDTKCRRGQYHRIAVAMGIKPDPQKTAA
jgi:gp16 family phage-associated protein